MRKLTLGLRLNQIGSGSRVLALIFYQDTLKNFVYDTDASGNAILVNKGSGEDGLLYTGRGVELGADNDLPIDTTGCASLVYHNGTNYVVVQSPSNQYTFNNETVLEIMPTIAEFTTEDEALIAADSTLLTRLALGEDNAGGVSLVTADVYGWYPMTENEGAYAVDAKEYTLDTDIVTNGGFDTDTNWVKSAGIIIADGVATFDGSAGSVYQPIGVVVGKTYKITFTVKEYISGTIKGNVGGNESGADRTSTGTFSDIITVSTGSNDRVYIISALFEGSIDDVIVEEILSSTEAITNYTASIRENVDQNQKGLQTTCLELDGVGIPTVVDFAKLHWYGVGYEDTQFNPSLYGALIIEENVNAVFYSHIYDGVNLTTWTDGIEGTPTAHSPENADYLLGKGVYPKVAADPYTIYTQDWFKTIDNAAQIAEYDGLQAYNDWAGI